MAGTLAGAGALVVRGRCLFGYACVTEVSRTLLVALLDVVGCRLRGLAGVLLRDQDEALELGY
jgi:hypothetical protein